MQSVAVRLITEREREIAAFVPVEYWSLHAKLKGKNPPDFVATLKEVRGEKADLPDEAATTAVTTGLDGATWTVKSVTRGERRRNPAPPFITSTLQQDASRKLHFTAKKTMMLAQQLYEGVELGEEGAVGLITYMRTDAVRVAAEAQEEAREWVTGRLGREYLPDAPPTYKAKKSAQEAHEAVRPSSVAREPKAVARFLSKDQLALYRLIWERFLASQMLPAVYDTVAADITAADALFRAQGSTMKFPGFTAVYVESREATDETPEEEAEAVMPPLTVGETLKLLALDPKQHFTQPPPRFTEASLVKPLEDRGIGRPSTYAQILGTIQDRGYVRRERGTLFPTDLGMQVTDMLVPHFPEVMDVEFTAQLEESLDKIEEGDADWVKTVETFYKQFSRDLKAGGQEDGQRQGRGGRRPGVPRVRQAAAREVGALREVPGVLRLPGLQVHQGHERRARAAGRRADRRDLPDVQQADGHQARPLRQVHRVLGLSGVQDHQAGDARDHVPAARTAAASSSRSAPARARPSTRARTTPRASSRSGRVRWRSRARSARPRS